MSGAWREMLAVIVQDFSDVAGIAQSTRLVLRLLLAAMLGFALGYERERSGKAAGTRTHMLVAIGSALFVLVAQEAGISTNDMSRVIQGLLTGIGFLCAGTIFRHGIGARSVRGLTTAAGMWMTAAIGLACGLGRGLTAVLSTLLALAVLAAVPRFQRPGSNAAPRDEDESA